MRVTCLAERVAFVSLSRSGQSDSQIAHALGWSVATVRKWRRRGQHGASLTSHMGRPRTGSLGSVPPPAVQLLRTWRQQHPGGGPVTLLVQAQQDPALTGVRLPSRASIARWLKQDGLTKHYERHHDLPPPSPATAQYPHHEWEMDAQGQQCVGDAGWMSLINLNDRFSHVKLMSYPCWLGDTRVTRYADAADYQLALRLAFCEWGLPDRLAIDCGSMYRGTRSKSPFPTMWHLWLIALGIEAVIGPPGQPTKRAITERSHQTWQHQVLDGQRFASWDALWSALQARRPFVNQHLPCRSCGDQPPLCAHPEAGRPRRAYHPAAEAAHLDLSHIWMYLSQGRWFRRTNHHGVVNLGSQLYCLGKKWAGHDVEINFDASDQHLIFQADSGQLTRRLPIKGITCETLIGDLEPLIRLQSPQLALPFSWHDWRVIRLSETLCATT